MEPCQIITARSASGKNHSVCSPSPSSSTTAGQTVAIDLEHGAAGDVASSLNALFSARPAAPANARAPAPARMQQKASPVTPVKADPKNYQAKSQ